MNPICMYVLHDCVIIPNLKKMSENDFVNVTADGTMASASIAAAFLAGLLGLVRVRQIVRKV